MKTLAVSHRFIQFIIGCGIVAAFFVGSSIAQAATFRGGETFSVPVNETVPGDIYGGGGTINVMGVVQGDLVGGAGTVTVQGTVNQDLMVGGGNITLLGAVGDDIRVSGGNITIGGQVAGDVVAAGGTVHILPGATIGGDVVFAGGQLTVDGTVGGSVWVRGGQVTLNSSVGQGVNAESEALTLGAAARIAGDLVYKSPNAATIADGALVQGSTTYTHVAGRAAAEKGAAAALFAIFSVLFFAKLVMLTVAALVLLWLFGPFVVATVRRVVEDPGTNALIGFLTVVATPIAAIILFITVVGIPLGAIVLVAWVFLLMLAKMLAMIAAGAVLSRMIRGVAIVTWKWTILGAVVLTLVGLVPVIGWLITFVLFIMSLGAVVQGFYSKRSHFGA